MRCKPTTATQTNVLEFNLNFCKFQKLVIMEEIKLSDLFEDAYKLFESFDSRDDATNSPEFQVSKAMRHCLILREQILLLFN